MGGDWQSPIVVKKSRCTASDASHGTSSDTRSQPITRIRKRPASATVQRKPSGSTLDVADQQSADCTATPIMVGSKLGRHGGALRVASDCSGWCSELWALKGLDVKVEHVFCSEIDRPATRLMKWLWGVKHVYPDLTIRDNTTIATGIDLYCAGFPCQPFSRSGIMKGTRDDRGHIFFHIADFLGSNKPEAFVLENVASLVTDFSETFTAMVSMISDIKDARGHAKTYTVFWKILHANEHGLPQHRERVFIIGLKTKSIMQPFRWPTPTRMRSLKSIFDLGPAAYEPDPPTLNPTNLKNLMAIMEQYKATPSKLAQTENVANVGGSTAHIMMNMCPCLTKQRSASRAYYSISRRRSLTLADMSRLQGVAAKDIEGWESVVSGPQLGGIIGNAIPICVMERVIRAVLTSLGHPVGPDRWLSAAEVPLV